jgi:hypothetical protein
MNSILVDVITGIVVLLDAILLLFLVHIVIRDITEIFKESK